MCFANLAFRLCRKDVSSQTSTFSFWKKNFKQIEPNLNGGLLSLISELGDCHSLLPHPSPAKFLRGGWCEGWVRWEEQLCLQLGPTAKQGEEEQFFFHSWTVASRPTERKSKLLPVVLLLLKRLPSQLSLSKDNCFGIVHRGPRLHNELS